MSNEPLLFIRVGLGSQSSSIITWLYLIILIIIYCSMFFFSVSRGCRDGQLASCGCSNAKRPSDLKSKIFEFSLISLFQKEQFASMSK